MAEDDDFEMKERAAALKSMYDKLLYFDVNSLGEQNIEPMDPSLTWEKFRKALSHIDVDWDNLSLDRTLVPLRVWIKAEIENNESDESRVEFEDFYR